jgi:hypothetical protein
VPAALGLESVAARRFAANSPCRGRRRLTVDNAGAACCHCRMRRLAFLGTLLAVLGGPSAGAQDCLIATGQAAHAAIVVAPELAGQLSDALADLRRCIALMTGADIPVSSEPVPGKASLRICAEPLPADAPGSQDLAKLNTEGFVLRVRGVDAWLCARTELGAQHAIYWLLEQWGCRWLFPGDAGEVVPRVDRLSVAASMETDQQPFFLMRSLWYNFATFLTEGVTRDRDAWMRRNRMVY